MRTKANCVPAGRATGQATCHCKSEVWLSFWLMPHKRRRPHTRRTPSAAAAAASENAGRRTTYVKVRLSDGSAGFQPTPEPEFSFFDPNNPCILHARYGRPGGDILPINMAVRVVPQADGAFSLSTRPAD
jgi:hypothetical protein